MKNVYFVIGLFVLVSHTVHSALPLFDDPNIETIHIVMETHTKLLKDGKVHTLQNPATNSTFGGENTFQSKVWIDVEQERIRQVTGKELISTNKPSHINLYVDDLSYSIMHERKMVLINQSDLKMKTSNFPLRGWFYEGLNLGTHISGLSRLQYKPHDDGGRSFWLRKPKVSYPAEFFINSQNQVIKVHSYDNDPEPGEENKIQTVEIYEWSKLSDRDFWYPAQIQMTIEMRDGMKYEEQTQVTDIKINEPIPEDLFTVEYPDDYRVQDMRNYKELRGVGGYGGFGGYGGGAQR